MYWLFAPRPEHVPLVVLVLMPYKALDVVLVLLCVCASAGNALLPEISRHCICPGIRAHTAFCGGTCTCVYSAVPVAVLVVCTCATAVAIAAASARVLVLVIMFVLAFVLYSRLYK